jgi:hypothetical protein
MKEIQGKLLSPTEFYCNEVMYELTVPVLEGHTRMFHHFNHTFLL